MKTIALMAAVALGGLTSYGADNSTTSATTQPSSSPSDCNCTMTAEGIQCSDSCWLDVETITIAAANGDPIAQFAIAYITDNGLNDTPQDSEKAQELYAQARPGLEKAAAEGNATACGALASMYAHGKGVDKDPAKAQEYMKRCKDSCKSKGAQKDASATPSDKPADM